MSFFCSTYALTYHVYYFNAITINWGTTRYCMICYPAFFIWLCLATMSGLAAENVLNAHLANFVALAVSLIYICSQHHECWQSVRSFIDIFVLPRLGEFQAVWLQVNILNFTYFSGSLESAISECRRRGKNP